MIVVEALLPSEIARLVYSYLIEEKCTEAAKTFLNESPNLYEYRILLQSGRTVPNKVYGMALLNMLETFCSINSIVQDKLAVFNNTHSIRKCNDIVTQIKFLLEECRSPQDVNSRNEPVQSINATASVTPSKTYKKRHSGKNDNGSNVATQSDDGYQTETPPDSVHNITSVEATPLEHLPGYIESLQKKKCEASQFMTVKSPTKTANKFTQSQQFEENVMVQTIQTLRKKLETHKICQASQTVKIVQSQEVQTSLRVSEADELLVPNLITNSIHKVQTDKHETSNENVNRLNTGNSVTHVKDKQSKLSDPKTNLCNNWANSSSNQEVINLDDSRDQTSLESPKKIDPGVKVSEECIEILEETNESGPEIVNTDSMNRTPVIESVPPAELSGITNEGTSSQNIIVLDSVCDEADLAKQATQTTPNNIQNNAEVHQKHSIDSTEPSLFDKSFPNPSEFSDHNTSTPLKLFTATQNYDTNEWFSTETLPSSNIVHTKETAVPVMSGFSFSQTATENIVSSVDGFISPIISKENTQIAEKISLNCSAVNTQKDDSLNTPDVPPVTKSLIPTMLAPSLPVAKVQPKNKTAVLPKNLDGENVPPNVHTSPGFSSISSLLKNTEFNRYFSVDSISVSQIDSTANTVENPSTVPEIQVEDSVGFTGTGLSPFLKIHKKAGDDNAESRKNENSNNTTNDIVEDTQALLNVKIAETNVKVSEIAMKDTLDAKVNESDCKMKVIPEITSKPAINPQARDIVAQTALIEAKETPEAVTIDEIDNEININEDVALTSQKIDINAEENVDSTLKDASNKADNKTNQLEEDLEQLLRTVVGEPDEIDQFRKENVVDMTSNVHDQTNVTTKNASTLNQTIIPKHIEPKVQVESGKKESLKSFICKTYEPYIENNKDNVSSNNNSEVPSRNTPKPLVEERAKIQRRSLSTPKKPNSHIRALNFETPIQSRSDSKINDKTRCASPETAKRNLKKLHESFQSPPVIHCDTDNQTQDNNEETPATIKAVSEKEKSDADKTSDAVVQLSQEKDVNKENAKKIWDSDLRMLCHVSEQPQVEAPKRKYKTKSKEEGSAKKKKRDKSKTPHKEKKSPHDKKSKKSEKDKTPKKSKKHDKSSEHKEHKNKDSKNTKTKAEDELSAKDCQDLGAQIESNLLLDNETVSKDEIKKKLEDKLSAKEYKDISAQIESNLLSSKNKVEIKSKSEEKSSAKENKDISAKIENNLMVSKNKNVKNNDKAKVMPDDSNILPNNGNKVKSSDDKKVFDNAKTNKVYQKLSKVETNLNEQKVAIKNMNSNGNQRTITKLKKTEVVTNVQEIPTQTENKEFPPTISKTTKKKDPLEYLLSDSINDEEAINDIMEMDSDDIVYHEELTRKPIDKEIAEKMVQDEQAIAAVLQEANDAINEKYKSNEEFFPETSLMTDGDESEEESELQEENVPLKDDKNFVSEKIEGVSIVQPEKEKVKAAQNNEEEIKSAQTIEKTPDTSSKPALDYDSIEKQLSILTNTEVPSARKVIYDQVHKLEDGKVVSKKYARLKTIDTKLATTNKLTSLGGYVITLDSSVKGDDSMEMPPTPQIVDPGSNSWVPNPLVKEDSRTIHSSIPTPLECPPTPKIFITPQKVEETVKVVPQKAETVPFYHLTPITFETTKKPEVTEFKVVKEVMKKTTPKTPNEKKEEEGKTSAKTPKSVNSSYKDECSSCFDSEDSDSSSSSDSSDSSSSSSDDDDDSSMQGPVLAKVKEDSVDAKPKPENKLQHIIQSEEVVAGNEIIFIEYEEIVVTHESSPTKVFKIHKTDKELEETVKETPAKDENMIPEEGIFETPNVSKPFENPTNLHAKISQMMILKEQEESRRLEIQEKPKIINNVRLSPKIVMKNYTPQVKPLSATNEQVKTMIVEKSEAEVAKAIESIANEKFDQSQDELNASNGSTVPPEVKPIEKVKKRELTKAIQSITKEHEDEDSSSGSSSDDESSSDGEPNLELILEDDVKSPRQGLNAEAWTDESSLEFENSEAHNAEFHVVFDEANYKKRRRTEIFTDSMLSFAPQDEDGNEFAKITPTCVDILFNLIPPKKKGAPKKKIKEEIKEEPEQEFDDGDSSESFVPAKNTRGGTKRKRLSEQPKSRKRKKEAKNIFIY